MTILDISFDEYTRLRREWAENLGESTLRSFASDYRHGNREEDCVDAYYEFLRRKELGTLKNPNQDVKYEVFCDQHKVNKRPGRCRKCRALNNLL